ncbi:MAG: hypothetical protein IJQ55_00520 [Alphaproteobacteria bacterium]|nr:hypothetical protein [Alphaproteobacteria bacterium]
MISFGSIKMGDAMGNVTDGNRVLAPGEIGVKDYLAELRAKNGKTPGAEGIISSIEDELNNIAGTINRTISLIESDQQIQYCINGRDLSQINGRKDRDNKTVARFPKLLNSYRVDIAMAALRKAQDNYNKKLSEAIAEATKESSADIAQYMCQMIPSGGGAGLDDGVQTPLNAPYAISYDVGTGLDLKSLTSGGKSGIQSLGNEIHTETHRKGAMVAAVGGGGGFVVNAGAAAATAAKWDNSVKIDVNGGTKEVTSVFNRETRICHVCTTISIEDCEKLKVGATKTNKKKCVNNVQETCEDIPM